MPEELQQRIKELESENQKLRLATQQWDRIFKLYKEANDKLQQLDQSLSATHADIEQALQAGGLSWWSWDHQTGNLKFDKNRACLLGYEEGEEICHTFDDLVNIIHPDDFPFVMERMKGHLDGTRPDFFAEYRIRAKSGEWKWFCDKGKIVETDIMGKPLKIAGTLADINQRKITEMELVEARDRSIADNQAKNSFLSSMSHEIYTPMAGVVGMAQILRQSKLSQEQNEYLEVIVKSATDLMSILNDIMEYSKIEAGKVEFHEKPFSIFQVVEEIASSLADKAVEKNIEILSYQDPNIPAEVVGDPVRLRQVLKIFTDNALKFTEKGEIRIEAVFEVWDEDTVRVRFSIVDTGIGISPEGIKKLFYSFSRLDSPGSKKHIGGGLGLAIAKHLVERMNGQISVDSVPGEGTTFTFSIVFERYKDAEAPDSMKGILRGKKVMIIDPQATHAELLHNYFERWDSEVSLCHDTEEAIKKIHLQAELRKPYNLIVVEYQRPGMNGLDFAARIKKDPLMKPSKILLTTSRLAPVTPVELATAGIHECLVRPYTLNRLKNRIEKTLSQSLRGTSDLEEDELQLLDIRKRALHVLIAEDNLIHQKVARVILEKIGHQVDVAENGKIAVAMNAEKKYDLILMDIFMPEMDGLEATIKIREMEAADPDCFPVHICAITANASEEDEEKCLRAGMNSYILKPFKFEELTRVLARV